MLVSFRRLQQCNLAHQHVNAGAETVPSDDGFINVLFKKR